MVFKVNDAKLQNLSGFGGRVFYLHLINRINNYDFFYHLLLHCKSFTYICTSIENTAIMAVTRLKRKGRKNKTVSKQRMQALKLHTQKPVIKNVDVEAMKAEFAPKATKAKKEAAPKAEESAAE
jgi:hypothetical protein